MNPFNVRLIYIGVLFTLDMIMQWAYGEQAGGKAVPSTQGSIKHQTYTIQVGEDFKIQQLAAIVDALENLNILGGNKQNCYMVDKITKLSKSLENGMQQIGIEFYVSQLQPSNKNSPNIDSINQSSNTSSLLTENKSDAQNSDNFTSTSSCHKDGFVTLIGEVNNDTKSEMKRISDASFNDTFAQGDNTTAISSGEGEHSKTEIEFNGKLSHTQLMVISTCSTVIGLFFIVALIMRVRNYLKRKNWNEDGSRRGNMRSTSMQLQSNSHSPARTESIAMWFS